jgi:hypothetical protein
MRGSELTALSQAIKESIMSDSLVFLWSRSNELRIVDPDELIHYDEISPLLKLAIAVINSGYQGIAVDELKRKNGRYVHSMDADISTPEGQVIQKLAQAHEEGRQLPEVTVVLDAIARLYQSQYCSAHSITKPGGIQK